MTQANNDQLYVHGITIKQIEKPSFVPVKLMNQRAGSSDYQKAIQGKKGENDNISTKTLYKKVQFLFALEPQKYTPSPKGLYNFHTIKL